MDVATYRIERVGCHIHTNRCPKLLGLMTLVVLMGHRRAPAPGTGLAALGTAPAWLPRPGFRGLASAAWLPRPGFRGLASAAWLPRARPGFRGLPSAGPAWLPRPALRGPASRRVRGGGGLRSRRVRRGWRRPAAGPGTR